MTSQVVTVLSVCGTDGGMDGERLQYNNTGEEKNRPFADRRKERFWSSTDGRDGCGTRDRFSQFLSGGEGGKH